MIYSTSLRSTGDARTPLYISLLSMSLNVVLNYLLILGMHGFPRMEVRGAALATVIARGVEVVLLLAFIYLRKSPVAAPMGSLIAFDRRMVRRYLATCTPVILNEMFWSLGMTAYKVAFSKMGIDVIASVNVSEAIQNLFFVALMGISNASAIMIGNRIGENRLEIASTYARRLLAIGFFPVASSRARALFTRLAASLNLSAPVARMTTLSSFPGSLFDQAFNMVLVVGVLRSGGDTRFSMFAELAGVWFIGVPCAFLGALFFGLPIHLLYLFVGLEEAFKFVVGMLRIRSGRWINRLAGEDPVHATT